MAMREAETVRALPVQVLLDRARALDDAILRRDLQFGDWLVIRTQNSVYSLCVLADGTYWAAGGWFDRHGGSPQRVGVNGCTFGGRAIKTDVVAATGLHLEFDNRVVTTRIREARILRDGSAVLH